MTTSRFDSIQGLRFLAAAMVVLTHSTFYTAERLVPGFPVWKNGTRGVEIFFVISGFVMIIAARKYQRDGDAWKDFAAKRIKRIVPLYWVATTLKLLALLAVPAAVLHAGLNPSSIAKSYFFIPDRNVDGRVEPLLGVGWTLVFEMFFYLVFTVGLATRRNVYFTVVPVLALCAIGSLFRPEVYPVWMFYLNPIVLDFLMGMLIGTLTIRGRTLPKNVALLSLPICVAYTILSPNLWQIPMLIEVGLPSAFIVASLVALEDEIRPRLPKLAVTLGAASYAIYLFHPMVAPIAPALLKKLHLPYAPLSVAGAWGSGIVAGLLIYLFVEKRLDAAVGYVSSIKTRRRDYLRRRAGQA